MAKKMLKSKDYPWAWLLWPLHYRIPQNKKKEKKEKGKEDIDFNWQRIE